MQNYASRPKPRCSKGTHDVKNGSECVMKTGSVNSMATKLEITGNLFKKNGRFSICNCLRFAWIRECTCVRVRRSLIYLSFIHLLHTTKTGRMKLADNAPFPSNLSVPTFYDVFNAIYCFLPFILLNRVQENRVFSILLCVIFMIILFSSSSGFNFDCTREGS